MSLILFIISFFLLVPIIRAFLAESAIEYKTKQFELLCQVVKHAVCCVNQLSVDEELSSDQKTVIAVNITNNMLKNLGIKDNFDSIIGDLIESTLWDMGTTCDEDDEDDDMH